MVQCKRIGHVTLETPDVERVAEYYEQVMGLRAIARTKDDIYFSTRVGQLALCVRKAASPRCSAMSFEIAPNTDLSELQSALSKDGIRSERASDTAPGVPKSLVLTDPMGNEISLFPSWSNVERSGNAGAAPIKLGHVAFIVDGPKKMAEFYGRHLGFKVSDWVQEFFVFMRCGADHHTVNFLQGSNTGMHHVAFEMRDTAHLIEFVRDVRPTQNQESSGDLFVTAQVTTSRPTTRRRTARSSNCSRSSIGLSTKTSVISNLVRGMKIPRNDRKSGRVTSVAMFGDRRSQLIF